jgi:CHAD domain-containing protein
MKSPLKKLEKYYIKAVKDLNREDVHQFRVELKKFRALTRLIFYNKQGLTFRIPNGLKGLYKQTGNIRNLELLLERVISFSFKSTVWPKYYISFIGSRKQACTKKAGKYKHKKACKTSEIKKVNNALDQLEKHKIEVYAFHQAGLLQNLLFIEHFEDNDLHQLRKFLKDILYNWKLIKPFITPLLPFIIQKKKQISSFTVLLGEFQDICVALEYVDHEFKPHLPFAEKLLIKNFRDELELQKLHLRKRILNTIDPQELPWHSNNFNRSFYNYKIALT